MLQEVVANDSSDSPIRASFVELTEPIVKEYKKRR
jgi:hypothetical protein